MSHRGSPATAARQGMKRRTPPRRPPVIPRLSETFLGGLPHDSRDALLADVSVHAVDAGGAILPAAVSEARVGVVLEGIARSFLTAADGRQLTVRYARPGAIIGRRAEAVGDHAPLRTQAV